MLHNHIDILGNKRVFIFGDVHGRYDLIAKCKSVLGIKEDDIKVFLSDVIDRGPENLKCFLEAYKKENTYSVIGNHEWMMVNGFIFDNVDWYRCWLSNGGLATLNEVGDEGCEWMANSVKDFPTCLTININNKILGFSHAGWPVELSHISPIDLSNIGFNENYIKHLEEVLVWDRKSLEEINGGHDIGPVLGVDYMFHGHSYVKEPLMHYNRIYMDTGSVFNGNLTVAILEPDGDLWFYSTLEED